MITITRPGRERFRGPYFQGMRPLVLAGLLLLAACSAAPAFNGVVLDPPEPAPPLRLADSAGTRFDLAAETGKVALVFFGYTHCPDVCPTTLVDWRHVADSLGSQAATVRFVFVSVDPDRDTPAVAQRYAARFSPAFLGLYGIGLFCVHNKELISPLVQAYLPITFATIGLIMVLKAFTERKSTVMSWFLVVMNHFWIALAVSFNEQFTFNQVY